MVRLFQSNTSLYGKFISDVMQHKSNKLWIHMFTHKQVCKKPKFHGHRECCRILFVELKFHSQRSFKTWSAAIAIINDLPPPFHHCASIQSATREDNNSIDFRLFILHLGCRCGCRPYHCPYLILIVLLLEIRSKTIMFSKILLRPEVNFHTVNVTSLRTLLQTGIFYDCQINIGFVTFVP